MIFNLAGPLSWWLCRADPGQELASVDSRAIWRDAFSSSYRHIEKLPPIESAALEIVDWLAVRDIEYWRFLRDIFDTVSRSVDRKRILEQQKPFESSKYSRYWSIYKPAHPLLIAAINNLWIAEMEGDPEFRNDLWRFYVAVKNGLLEYVRHVLGSEELCRSTLQGHTSCVGTTMNGDSLAVIAAANGHHDVIGALINSAFPVVKFGPVASNAAGRGHLDTLKWLQLNIPDEYWTNSAMDAAAFEGHLHVVKWLHENRTEGCTSNAMDWAASSGHLDVVKFLQLNRWESCTMSAMSEAARFGHLHVVKWFQENRSEGCNSDLKDFNSLHRKRLERCFANPMDSAACYGQLHVVRWLHENRSQGCTSAALDGAAYNGHLEVVKFLHGNCTEGCDNSAINSAAGSGKLDVIKWLHENRSEGSDASAIDLMSGAGRPEAVKSRKHICSEACSAIAMDAAARSGHLHVVRWLHENRTEGCTTDAMDRAAENGHLDVVRFLHFNRSEGCTSNALLMAVKAGHLEIVKFLSLNRSEVSTREALKHARYRMSEIVIWLKHHAPDAEAVLSDPEFSWLKNYEPLTFAAIKSYLRVNSP